MKNSSQQIPSQKVRRRGRNSLAIVLGAFACLSTLALSPAHASVIVQDDFNVGASNTPPDSTKWATPSEYPSIATWNQGPLDGSGHVSLKFIGNFNNNPRMLAAKPIFLTAPTPRDLRLTMTVMNALTNLTFGLRDWSTPLTSLIELRNDGLFGAAPVGTWGIYMSSDSFTTYDARAITDITAATATNGTWVFNWAPTQVTILFNNALVFNSASALYAPTQDGGPLGWQIPTAAMVPSAYSYDTTGVGLVDAVLFETIPEPSTVLLLGIGGLLIGRRFGKRA